MHALKKITELDTGRIDEIGLNNLKSDCTTRLIDLYVAEVSGLGRIILYRLKKDRKLAGDHRNVLAVELQQFIAATDHPKVARIFSGGNEPQIVKEVKKLKIAVCLRSAKDVPAMIVAVKDVAVHREILMWLPQAV